MVDRILRLLSSPVEWLRDPRLPPTQAISPASPTIWKSVAPLRLQNISTLDQDAH